MRLRKRTGTNRAAPALTKIVGYLRRRERARLGHSKVKCFSRLQKTWVTGKEFRAVAFDKA
jgi:hypothetical protein